ncbi:MAG: cation:proton antiporter [Candidatus Undinarchaeales archaeon]
MSSLTPFALTGIILIIGFLGNYLFKKTKIPDVLILIFLGFLIGPILGFVQPSSLAGAVPIFVALALIVILFDGGLNLNLNKVLKESSRSISLATVGFIFSVIITTGFTHYLFGWNYLTGILLGAIIGGVSSSAVLPLIFHLKTSETAKTVLSLEAVFTDTLVIIVSLSVLKVVSGTAGSIFVSAARGIASAFSIGIVVGAIAGVLWLKVIKIGRDQDYFGMFTLAFVLLMYAVVEALGGNGAIFALIFGLVLGNGIMVSKLLRMRKLRVEAGKVSKRFHGQISFFMKSFFFVYLGMLVSVANIEQTLLIVVYSAVLTILLLAGRFVAVNIVKRGSPALKENRDLITVMLPRGLSAAVLSRMIVASGIAHAEIMSQIVIFVILISTIVSAVGTAIVAKHPKLAGPKEK